MIVLFLTWYLASTLVGLAALPLALRLFEGLPGGAPFARPLGILLTGYLFWIGFATGLLGNETGGAWLALLAVAAGSLWLGRGWRERVRRVDKRAVLAGELLFLAAFALWAYVRAHDPAADHTEEPMDLMFLSSLWASPAFPPQDAWLSGYPIGYYYGGYWLLTTLGRLAGTPPEITYTVGQALWYGLLLAASFALVHALLRLPRRSGERAGAAQGILGGLLGAAAVGVAGNVQFILEWLYAQGVNVSALARWAQVRNFPESARVTNNWYIASGEWWWWRTSRVLADTSLRGEHQEVIAEFPAFSYVLGDNHPHVLAMPVVILVIALALAWLLAARRAPSVPQVRSAGEEEATGWRDLLPRDPVLVGVTAVALGSLLFINTWDFPPYWLLIMLVIYTAEPDRRLARAALGGLLLLGLSLLLYLPYFLTAQSQARGIAVPFFSPTRLGQFLWMFLPGLLAIGALIVLAWRERRPALRQWSAAVALAVGIPALFIALAWLLTQNSGLREGLPPLPEAASGSYLTFLLGRRLGEPWVLLLVGLLLGTVAALWWARRARFGDVDPATAFALLLAGVGLALVLAPEFVYLRDNFGTRMNTVFKFYYQGWLLFGLGGSYAVARALAGLRQSETRSVGAALLATPALALVIAATLFTAAAAYSKTNGFAAEPTFDAAAWVQNAAPAELAAARWLRDTAPRAAVVAQAIGQPYDPGTSRISTLSGRATLIGWEGHERQWRGDAYNDMAAGRAEALETIYRTGSTEAVLTALDAFGIDYVAVGPRERQMYALSPADEERLLAVMNLAWEQDSVRIYQRR